MRLAGLQHENAFVFFDDVSWNLFQAFGADGGRRFDQAIKFEILTREGLVSSLKLHQRLLIIHQ